MGILREQREGLGFNPSSVAAVNVAEQIAVVNQKKEPLQDHFTCENLNNCKTVNKFKQVAKNILLQDWTLIQEIIQKAHSFNGEGGKKLIWFFYQVRDGLMLVTQKNRERFLSRAFRRSGATLDIPE